MRGIESDTALEIRDRRIRLAEIAQQRTDVKLDVGVARNEVRYVDHVLQAALGIAQVGLIQFAKILARQHVRRIRPQRGQQLDLRAIGRTIAETHDAEAHVCGRGVGIESDRGVEFLARIFGAVSPRRRFEEIRKPQAHVIHVIFRSAARGIFLDVGDDFEFALLLGGRRIEKRDRERVIGHGVQRRIEIRFRALEIARVKMLESRRERQHKRGIRIVVALRRGGYVRRGGHSVRRAEGRRRKDTRQRQHRGERAGRSKAHGTPFCHRPTVRRRARPSGKCAAAIFSWVRAISYGTRSQTTRRACGS